MAHNRKCESVRHVFEQDIHYVEEALVNVTPHLQLFLREQLFVHKMLKVACILTVKFVKIEEDGDQIILSTTAPFCTKTHLITSLRDEEDI